MQMKNCSNKYQAVEVNDPQANLVGFTGQFYKKSDLHGDVGRCLRSEQPKI